MDFIPKKVVCEPRHPDFFPVIGLEMNDKNGKEYHDGDVVRVFYKIDGFKYPMLGFIRYSYGRFEIVCPWKQGNGVHLYHLGLNPDHEIIGHIYNDDKLIGDQLKREFKKEGAIKA